MKHLTLTLVRHGTRYDTGHGDTSFLEKLGYDTGGVYVFLYIFYILLGINYVYSWFFIKKREVITINLNAIIDSKDVQ
jgi:hypothetical protein